MSLLDLLLLVFLQALLTLVGSQLAVRSPLGKVVGVLAVATSSSGVLIGSIATCVRRLLLISFKCISLFEFWALAAIDSVFILAICVLASTQLLDRSERADRL